MFGRCSLLLIFSIFVINCLIFVVYAISCNDAHSCNSAKYMVAEAVRCLGYSTCQNTTIESTLGTIQCYGSHSCINASISIEPFATIIQCMGLFSCNNAHIIHNSTKTDIYCRSESSCMNSIIEIHDNNKSDLDCSAYRSCSDSIIYVEKEVTASGSWAAQNSIIYTTRNNTRVEFVGAFAGYNASIYCKNGLTCEIICYGSACINLTAT